MYSKKARHFSRTLERKNGILTTEISVVSLMQKKYLFWEKIHVMEIQHAVIMEHFISAETQEDVKQQLPKLRFFFLRLIHIICI